MAAGGRALRAHRGGIARRPPARFRQRQETRERFVEQRRLFEIQDVTGLRKHSEAGRWNISLQEQAWLDAGLILVAGDCKRRQRQTPDAIFECIERRPPALKAAEVGRTRSNRLV